jgi:hypothetical protein
MHDWIPKDSESQYPYNRPRVFEAICEVLPAGLTMTSAFKLVLDLI